MEVLCREYRRSDVEEVLWRGSVGQDLWWESCGRRNVVGQAWWECWR